MKNVEDIYPLSPLQHGLLFHSLMEPGFGVYVNQLTCTLPEELDSQRFRQAWERLVERHGALRTAFLWDGLDEPLQVVRKTVSLPWQTLDWHDLPGDEQQSRLEELRHRDRQAPLNLSKVPLMRFSLVHLEHGFGFVWTFHHLLVDGWSIPLLIQELGAIYAALTEGREPALAPARPYGDYIAWLQEQDSSQAEPFWRGELAGFTAPTPLGIDRPAGTAGASGYCEHTIRVSREVTEQLQSLAVRHRLTLQTVTLGAWAVLLSRYSREEDVVFGSVVSGRPASLPGVETVVGMFINTLPVRVRVPDAEPLAPWLQRLQERQLARQELEHTSLTQIQRWSEVPFGSPLFETLYVFENYPAGGNGGSGGLRIDDLRSFETTNYPITLLLAAADRISLHVTYDRTRLDGSAALRLLHHLGTLLAGMAERPEPCLRDLSLLSERERHQVLTEWNDTGAAWPAGGFLHDLFAAQVARTPDAPAATFGGATLSYAELAIRAHRLARHLRGLGCGPEQRVGVALPRALDLLVSLLGVLEAGAVYVPLDPEYPRDRLALLLEDSRPAALLTQEDLLDRLPIPPGLPVVLPAALPEAEGEAGTGSLRALGENALAYVIYTSGSTGRPKGAMVAHGGMLNHLRAKIMELGLEPQSRVAQTASPCFDISVWQLLAPLLAGASVQIANEATVHDPELLLRFVARERITVLEIVPSLLPGMLGFLAAAETLDLSCLRWLIVTGEACAPDLANRWLELAPHTRLLNAYGPTECSDDVTHHRMARPEGGAGLALPIGRPVVNTRICVLDPRGQPAAPGVAGELCVAGSGVGRGYLGLPTRTAEVFVPDPWSGEPGSRLYRTGDLARWLANGTLEFLGRLDHQVKVRGFRIELGEIEAALVALDGVREAAVLVREDTPGNQRLVAYVAGDASGTTAAALSRSLRERLPEHMVPAVFVTLPELPLTPNGKVDRKALPVPEQPSTGESHLAPRSPVEEILAGIWAEVLGLERIGVADHFFERGGHSLLATQVTSRLRSAFGVEMPLRDLFEAPVLADLATRVEARLRAGTARPEPPLVPVPRHEALPLSFAQQRLWLIDQLQPGSALYNIPIALRIAGPLNSAVLERSLGEVVRRHEALRTVFVLEDGSPVQVIQPAAPFRLPVVDLSGLPESRREALALALAGEEAGRPFDLARGPLLRSLLLRLAGQDHAAALTMHHIASDGWSEGILVREVVALYAAFAEGRPSPLPELPIQYVDFAVWQLSWLQGEVLEEEISYWRRQLAGLPPLLLLPTDRPRPAVQSFRGASRPVRLPDGLTRQAEALGRRHGATIFMVLLAAFQTLLARYSGQQDLAVGSPVAGRNRFEIEGLIGFFINTLVLRGDLTGEPTFRELLGRVRESALAAHTHQDVPFDRLVEELASERSLAHAPLFQVVFVLQNAPVERLTIRDLRLQPLGGETRTAKFDLTLNLEEHGGGLAGMIEFANDLFDAPTIDRLILQYERLLGAGLEAPELKAWELPLLQAAERHQVLVEWNDTAMESEETARIQELFEDWAKRAPEAVALVWNGEEITYGRLEEQANRLAHHLAHLGLGPGSLVGVHLRRSPGMIVAVLAVLKAGAAYVPLEIGHPPARLRLVLGALEIGCLITESAQLGTLQEIQAGLPGLARVVCLDAVDLEGYPPSAPQCRSTPDDLAYIIFTSGSTGTPKGVMVRRRPVANLLRWAYRTFGFSPKDRVLFVTALSFDLSVFDIFGLLGAGGSVRIATEEEVRDPRRLLEALAEEPITFWDSAPAALEQTVPFLGVEPQAGAKLRLVFLSGDWIPVTLPDRIRGRFPNARVVSLGGATEATVWSNVFPVETVEPGWTSIPYGRPIENARYHVLDEHWAPCPMGVPGDLYIGGGCLADGYAREPELTAHKFLPDPWATVPGARLYRTGDRARYLRDGNLEFLGRRDHQVKIRGFRIELGEIEAALATLPGVREAAVVVREDRPEEGARDRRLVAYVAGDAAVDVLRRSLRERLPEYMVPTAFVTLAALPLTPNGKVDRKALPAPERAIPGTNDRIAPRTAVEEMLAGIWAEILEVSRVERDSDFFALGGHSLLATRVMARAREAFGVELPMRTLFEAPTLATLSERIDALIRTGFSLEAPPIVPIPREGELPLSFSQQRLWFLHQLDPGSAAYNSPVALRLMGRLDVPALQWSLGEVVRRHEVLRTRFEEVRGRPRQTIVPACGVPLSLADLSALPDERRTLEIHRLAAEEAARPFDLARGPLLRVALLRSGETEHVCLLTLHHIVSDGWSESVLVREVSSLYQAFLRGEPSPLPELPIQYADFAHWQRHWMAGQALEAHLRYWRRRLAGAPPLLALPTDRPRPASPSLRGARHPFVLPEEVGAALRRISREEGVTLFMTLLAGFKILLHRLTGHDDLVVGTDIANRTRPELEGLIGFFINGLALRTDLSGNPTFRELLARVRDLALEAYAHQDLPFDRLVEELQPRRDPSYNPIFQVLFVLQNAPREILDLEGLRLSPFSTGEATAKFDLAVFLEESGEQISGVFEYSTDLFDTATLAKISDQFCALLARSAARPEARLSTLERPTVEEPGRRQPAQGRRQEERPMKFRSIQPKMVTLPQEDLVRADPIAPGEPLPLVLRPNAPGLDLADWASANRSFVESRLLTHGGILFRGFNLSSVDDFERFAGSLCPDLFGEYGDLPREGMGGKVYSSTPYPADKPILFHNESSHLPRWPMRIFFYCVQPAEQGGETPIVDCRKVYQRLPPETRRRFEEKRLMYVRNYTEGLDVSWTDFFRTTDRAQVEARCREMGTEVEWKEGNGLRTRQICRAVIEHPATGEPVFFNQVQLHHVSTLEPEVRRSLLSLFPEEDLPRNVYYGDGTPIEDEVMAEVATALRDCAVEFAWQAGDVVMLDNMLTAHSRNPYVGARKIVVALGQMYNPLS